MDRRWCVREEVFERDDGLWWLKKEQHNPVEKSRTPMTIALRNGNISGVIDSKIDGLSAIGRKGGRF
jgi:hypothetical protein